MIYCENIVNVALFFFLLLRFRNHIFSPPFSVMALPQLLQKFFSPISAMVLPQLVCHNFFFFSLWALNAHFTTSQQELSRGISVFTLSKFNIFSLPRFSSSLSYFLLNFGNGDTEIHSLSSKSWITFNNSYNANKVQILQY